MERRPLVVYCLISVFADLLASAMAAAQTHPLPPSTNTATLGNMSGSRTLTAEPTTNFSLGSANLTYHGNGAGNGSAVGGFETSITLMGTIANFPYLLSSHLISKALCPTGKACGQAVAVEGGVQRYLPGEGIPPGGQMIPVWGLWAPQTDYTDLPTSIAGAMLNEFDIATNNLDDATDRAMLSAALTHRDGHGYATEAQGLSLTSNQPATAWFESGLTLNGPYNLAGLDFRTGSTRKARITSATPRGNVASVTVDDVLPFARGGNSYSRNGQWMGSASTRATTGIASTTTVSSTRNVKVSAACGADSTCIQVGEYVTDVTEVSRIPPRTRLTSGSGTEWVLSQNVRISAGDELIFARGAKKVILADGSEGTVVGVTLSRPGSPAGTVYFNGPITPAAAANGAWLTPVAPTLWMSAGNGANIPPGSISFDDAANATLACNANPCTAIVAGLPLAAPGLAVIGKPLTVPVATGLAASGHTQETALALSASVNVVSRVASGTGVIVPATVGAEIEVLNRSEHSLLVYPPRGASIDGGAMNVAVSAAARGKLRIVCATSTACYSE